MKENAHDMFFGSWYNLEDGSGVYAIVNSLDNKKYIGSTGTLGNLNTTRVSIKRCYQGKQKSAYGYIWKLKNTQNDR